MVAGIGIRNVGHDHAETLRNRGRGGWRLQRSYQVSVIRYQLGFSQRARWGIYAGEVAQGFAGEVVCGLRARCTSPLGRMQRKRDLIAINATVGYRCHVQTTSSEPRLQLCGFAVAVVGCPWVRLLCAYERRQYIDIPGVPNFVQMSECFGHDMAVCCGVL